MEITTQSKNQPAFRNITSKQQNVTTNIGTKRDIFNYTQTRHIVTYLKTEPIEK